MGEKRHLLPINTYQFLLWKEADFSTHFRLLSLFAMDRLLSSAFVFLLVAQCALSMVIPEERNKREATENEEVEMVAGDDVAPESDKESANYAHYHHAGHHYGHHYSHHYHHHHYEGHHHEGHYDLGSHHYGHAHHGGYHDSFHHGVGHSTSDAHFNDHTESHDHQHNHI